MTQVLRGNDWYVSQERSADADVEENHINLKPYIETSRMVRVLQRTAQHGKFVTSEGGARWGRR